MIKKKHPQINLQFSQGSYDFVGGLPPHRNGSPGSIAYPLVPNMARRHPMGRRLYYQDSYGRVRRDRRTERRAGSGSGPLIKPFILTLMILAAFIVLASLVH